MYQLYLIALLTILSSVLQNTFLPLFISTFTSTTCNQIQTGPYFILFIASLIFIVWFGIWCIHDYRMGRLTVEMMDKHKSTLFLIGLFNALNGIMMVFSSSLSRTSGGLQAILLNLSIPITFVLSSCFVNRYVNREQVFPTIIITCGILLGIIPSIPSAVNIKDQSISIMIYPLIFALSTIPGSSMNVIQHKIYDEDPHYNKSWLLFGQSVVQFIVIALCFWIDLIPGFGTSNSLTSFNEHFKFGMQCFFTPDVIGGRCYYCAPIGLLFCVAYCSLYYYQSVLINTQSANLAAIINSISPALSILIWFSIPLLTEWGCGPSYSFFQIIMGLLSIPFIIIGTYFFLRNDESSETHEKRRLIDKRVAFTTTTYSAV